MGIVSIRNTRELRANAVSSSDADDPLPAIDDQLGINQPDPEPAQRRYLKISPLAALVFTLAVLLGGVGIAFAFAPGRSSNLPSTSPGESAKGQSTAYPVVPNAAGTMTLDVPDQGYALDYPTAWIMADTGSGAPGSGDGSQPIVLQISGDNAFSISTFPLEKPVAKSELADMRAVTDAILSTPEAKLTILDVRSTEVGGLPAVYYLYYFPSGKQQGIHAHYFIFDGVRMHSMVFQVVPASQFQKYAAAFDAVVATFRKTS